MEVLFMQSKYILPENMIYIIKKYFFVCLFIIKNEENTTKKIILFKYKDNI